MLVLRAQGGVVGGVPKVKHHPISRPRGLNFSSKACQWFRYIRPQPFTYFSVFSLAYYAM